MRQAITPNPNIPCKPGWCLAYVNEAFGVPKKYPSATSAWFGSRTKHEDRDFPPGVWVPVWYGLDTTPLGHVVLLAPDGSVYSTSDLTNTPHHHPDLADLEAYYAYYGMTLTYRGWTEDVEDTPVMSSDGIAAMGGTITPIQEDDDMAVVSQEEWDWAKRVLTSLSDNVATKRDIPTADENKFVQAALVSLVNNVATKADLSGVSAAVANAVGAKASRADIEAAVRAGMSAGLKVDVTVK